MNKSIYEIIGNKKYTLLKNVFCYVSTHSGNVIAMIESCEKSLSNDERYIIKNHIKKFEPKILEFFNKTRGGYFVEIELY